MASDREKRLGRSLRGSEADRARWRAPDARRRVALDGATAARWVATGSSRRRARIYAVESVEDRSRRSAGARLGRRRPARAPSNPGERNPE